MLSKGIAAAKVIFFKILVNSKSLFFPLILTVKVLVAANVYKVSDVEGVSDNREVWTVCWAERKWLYLINGLNEAGISLSLR